MEKEDLRKRTKEFAFKWESVAALRDISRGKL